jgi:hypothetical protein
MRSKPKRQKISIFLSARVFLAFICKKHCLISNEKEVVEKQRFIHSEIEARFPPKTAKLVYSPLSNIQPLFRFSFQKNRFAKIPNQTVTSQMKKRSNSLLEKRPSFGHSLIFIQSKPAFRTFDISAVLRFPTKRPINDRNAFKTKAPKISPFYSPELSSLSFVKSTVCSQMKRQSLRNEDSSIQR